MIPGIFPEERTTAEIILPQHPMLNKIIQPQRTRHRIFDLKTMLL